MLLSIDWDAYSGCREWVFDAPIWGTPDREADRVERWRGRVAQRGGTGWEALAADFPLYGEPYALTQYAGLPTFSAWSHAHAWAWLAQYPGQDVLNVDSHHDLYSLSGDPQQVRPGNWSGLGLRRGLVRQYTALYPEWHADLPVAEGYDLARTYDEVRAAVPDLLPRLTLERTGLEHTGLEYTRQSSMTFDRANTLPPRSEVTALLLVQSPSWTSPAHDPVWFDLLELLNAQAISPSYRR